MKKEQTKTYKTEKGELIELTDKEFRERPFNAKLTLVKKVKQNKKIKGDD